MPATPAPEDPANKPASMPPFTAETLSHKCIYLN
jgi:hypothetical protein